MTAGAGLGPPGDEAPAAAAGLAAAAAAYAELGSPGDEAPAAAVAAGAELEPSPSSSRGTTVSTVMAPITRRSCRRPWPHSGSQAEPPDDMFDSLGAENMRKNYVQVQIFSE